MLNYDAQQWRALTWWERRAYTEGIRWEMENAGLYPQRVVGVGAGGGGEGAGPKGGGTFLPMDGSLESRRAEGIQTSIVYQ